MYPDSFPPPIIARRPRRTTVGPVDPVAVVFGNASLLGIGYLFLRRPKPAAAALSGTVLFALILAADPDAVFWRILAALWWVGLIVHSWWLTRPTAERPLLDIDDPPPAGRPRVLAVGVAGLVLITFLGLRWDTLTTVRSAAEAHADGDCAPAIESLEQLGATHRVAYGSMTATGETDLDACRLLVAALDQRPDAGAETLKSYLEHPGARWDGAGARRGELLLRAAREAHDDVDTILEAGFAQLTVTLEKTPGQSPHVREVVEGFMSDLAEDTAACDAKRIDDWVYDRSWHDPQIADPIDEASDDVPGRMLACAQHYVETDEREAARKVYRQFLDRFPDHESAEQAADELYKVESAIERLEVEGLLDSDEYCDAPAPYRGAESAKGSGPHKMRMFGLSPGKHGFPKSWKATDVDDTVLAVCVDGPKRGSFQQSCYYESPVGLSGITKVKFYASKFTIKAYEIKTGKRVAKYTAQIGDPCPAVLSYRTFGADIGPPGKVRSEYTDADVRSMFTRLVE